MTDSSQIPAWPTEVTSVAPAAPALLSPTQVEELKHAIKKPVNNFQSARFDELATIIHQCLKEQDSDKALKLITRWALSFRSSDMHFECYETSVPFRLRIDGELVTVFHLSFAEYKLVIERMKYRSNLKLNITDVPQDGKYRIDDTNGHLDVRVSTLPVKWWENAVCRILDSVKNIPSIVDLGVIWTAKRQIEKTFEKSAGMIIVTGPTGSGKTTTLYSLLSTLNTPDKKIITLEDPIEYELEWIVQSEVNPKNNYTYETGLKALLRQDPDIIMVDEIRDHETANTAVQAALTWHLVLSTLHTKSAVETLERLLNIGLAPYLLASAVDIIIAQRLVRKLCPHCRVEYDPDMAEKELIDWVMREIGMASMIRARKEGYKLYRSGGCDECGNTGYKGRVGIYEVLAFNDEIRAAIRAGVSPQDILVMARKQDLILMREDGILKALRGKIDLTELFRVVE